MAQLNVEVDDGLIKRVKLACIEDNTNLKKWVSAALELALDFDEVALARCRELGWTPGKQDASSWEVAEKDVNMNIVEIIDVPPPPSKPKRIKKT